MKSPTPPMSSDHGTPMHHLITPAARIFAAMVILITGAGVSAVFWKMPNSGEPHALYPEKIVGKGLAAVPLPSDMVAAISHEEMQQMELPALDFTPVADGGVDKYAQVYQMPATLAMLNVGQDNVVPLVEEIKPSPPPSIPQKFEPIRHIVEKKPISLEPVSRDFMSKPVSVNIADRSDELLMEFQFVKNNKVNFDQADSENETEPAPPVDPFPITVASIPMLQPLKPLSWDNILPPLLPLEDMP